MKKTLKQFRDEAARQVPLSQPISEGIDQLPPQLVLKRQNIRVFPDGLQVATYSDDRGNIIVLPQTGRR